MKKIGLLYIGEVEGNLGTIFEVWEHLCTGLRFVIKNGLTSISGK